MADTTNTLLAENINTSILEKLFILAFSPLTNIALISRKIMSFECFNSYKQSGLHHVLITPLPPQTPSCLQPLLLSFLLPAQKSLAQNSTPGGNSVMAWPQPGPEK